MHRGIQGSFRGLTHVLEEISPMGRSGPQDLSILSSLVDKVKTGNNINELIFALSYSMEGM